MQSSDEDEDDDGREESTDRQLGELLSELRVILPAVTVLFAFPVAPAPRAEAAEARAGGRR